MFVDSSVIVIKKDGTRVLTTEVHKGDEILGTSYDELLANQIATSGERDSDWVRTDADAEPHDAVSVAPVVIDKAYPIRPDKDDSKSVWWNYAKELGYPGTDYDGITKAKLIHLYGEMDANAAQPSA